MPALSTNPRAMSTMPSTPKPAAALSLRPWRSVTADHARQAIEGSMLAGLVEILAEVTSPPLPLELTLPKALVLAGAALSQQDPALAGDAGPIKSIGISRASFRIATAGGQACNVWALIVAPSGTGKDIGNLPETVSALHNLHLGTSGSAEGLADAIAERPAGLLAVSEFSPYLDRKAWQYQAAAFLTHAWNKGQFRVNLSRRNNAEPREAHYCFPSILASIQPELLARRIGDCAEALESGFIGRFLTSFYRGREVYRPRVKTGPLAERCAALVESYLLARGEMVAPQDYLGDVLAEFMAGGADFPSIYSRLVNEYGPRFVAMLACDRNGKVTPSADHWQRAAVLVRWFYAMAEAAYGSATGTDFERRREEKLERILAIIRRHSPCARMTLSQNAGKSTNSTARERAEWVRELEARGHIRIEAEGRGETYVAV